MSPALIALIGVLIGTLLSVMGYRFTGEPKNVIAQTPTPPATNENDAVMCSVYEIRMTQQKMVDAGIIKAHEMSVCENENCNNCKPPRTGTKPVLTAKRMSNRTKLVRGERVQIPDGVPEYAYPSIRPVDSSFFEVVWTWTGEGGRQYSMKSIHPVKGAIKAGPRPTIQDVQKHYNENKKQMLSQMKKAKELTSKSPICSCSYSEVTVDQLLDSVHVFKDAADPRCPEHGSIVPEGRWDAEYIRKQQKSTGSLGPL